MFGISPGIFEHPRRLNGEEVKRKLSLAVRSRMCGFEGVGMSLVYGYTVYVQIYECTVHGIYSIPRPKTRILPTLVVLHVL